MALVKALVVVLAIFLQITSNKATTKCREEALLAVEDTSEGVVISIFSATSETSSIQASVRYVLQGYHLSQECGPNLLRCQKLFEETFSANQMQHSVVFIPLGVGLALVEVVRDATALFSLQHFILRTDQPMEISCSPSAVYKILHNYFAICTNQTTNFVSVVEVHLNKTSLGNSQIFYPSNRITIPASVGNISDSSNFIHIEIDPGHEYLVFALGTAFFSLRPFIYSENRLEDVPSASCDGVHSLVPLSGSMFYAYCTDHLFTYDIGEQDWLYQDTFMRRGIPYQCPKPNADLSVFPGYIEYSINGLNTNVELQGRESPHGLSGECFGNANQTYFAFQEEDIGVSLLDLENSELKVVSASPCEEDCLPLLTWHNRYLIITNPPKENMTVTVLVLDLFGEQLRVIEVLHVRAPPLVALLRLKCGKSPPGGEVVPVDPISPKDNRKVIVGVSVCVAIVIVVVILTVVTGMVIYLVISKSRSLSTPYPETNSINKAEEDKHDYIVHGSIVNTETSPEPKQETLMGREKTFQCAGLVKCASPGRLTDAPTAFEMSEIVHDPEEMDSNEISTVSQSSDISSDTINFPLLKNY